MTDLPEINPNTGAPWRCVTPANHECDGVIVGALGAYPVCAAGAVAEQAARDAHDARMVAWRRSPEGRRTLRAEAALNRHMARRA